MEGREVGFGFQLEKCEPVSQSRFTLFVWIYDHLSHLDAPLLQVCLVIKNSCMLLRPGIVCELTTMRSLFPGNDSTIY